MDLRLNLSLNKLNNDIIRKIIKYTYIWCKKTLGANDRVQKPLKIKTVFKKTKDREAGTYDFLDPNLSYRLISIFVCNNVNIKDLISTVIHEYQHHLQPLTKYHKLLKDYFYSHHPHERQANRAEVKYTKICWGEIKKKL